MILSTNVRFKNKKDRAKTYMYETFYTHTHTHAKQIRYVRNEKHITTFNFLYTD
jgi:hypothetical protein